ELQNIVRQLIEKIANIANEQFELKVKLYNLKNKYKKLREYLQEISDFISSNQVSSMSAEGYNYYTKVLFSNVIHENSSLKAISSTDLEDISNLIKQIESTPIAKKIPTLQPVVSSEEFTQLKSSITNKFKESVTLLCEICNNYPKIGNIESVHSFAAQMKKKY